MTIIGNINLVENCTVTPADIVIDKETILRIAAPGSVKKQEGHIYIEGKGLYLSHGFIDIHVHGGGGADFMDGTKEAWHQIARLHGGCLEIKSSPEEGTRIGMQINCGV